MRRFRDRQEAGQELAARLLAYRGQADLLVLALPRGGVPVAFEVARALEAPLDLCLVRKLGLPGREELAFGAIASGGVRVLNDDIVEASGIDCNEIELVTARETIELARREKLYRGRRPPVEAGGKKIILVDDGLATGATVRAAIVSLLACHPRQIIVALPVAASKSCRELALLDPLITVLSILKPDNLESVGFWYDDFSPVEDDEVTRLLDLLPPQR